MVSTPLKIPVARPDVDEIVAMVGLPLVHTPPDVAFASVMLWVIHTLVGPVVGDSGFTVITREAAQPLNTVKVMVVVPAVTPVT